MPEGGAPVRLRFAAALCVLVALGWLSRLGWPSQVLPDSMRTAAAFLLALNAVQVYVLLVLRTLLASRVSATSPRHYSAALAAVFATGVLGNASLLLAGAAVQQASAAPVGPYGVGIASYSLLSQLALGVLLIAFGYSVRRTVREHDATLRWYADTQIVGGFGLSSFALAGIAALAMGAGYLLLGAALWDAARPVRRARGRHALGQIKRI